ncbi:MAG: hypothetical protein IT288_18630 [Bdellovibrionales bacterium]|nr:hypothetical protein [Bdellovibrionales bacterium]
MNTEANRIRVGHVLEAVAEQTRSRRAIVLTESDLKCQVYSNLIAVPEFGRFQDTFDPEVSGISVHTETKFFDSRGLLRQAPDLVITSPSRLSIKTRIDGEALPSKGFHFDGSAILIELKFLKKDGRLAATDLGKIEQDILKGETLNRRGDLDFHLFVAVFDRFVHGQEPVNDLFLHHRNQENLTCRYFPGGPSFRA